MSAADFGLLHRSQVPYVFREPYIIRGYRQPGSSVVQCLRYAFVLHNDVGNFWTHFIPLLIWLWWYYSLSIDFSDAHYYPLWCFWMGACSYVLFSSLAHLFSTISFTVRTVCFVLDYLGIAMYAFGGCLATQFYEPPVTSLFIQYKKMIAFLGAALAVNATVLCTLSRFYWKRYRFVIRTLAYVLPFILSVLPFYERLWFCIQTGEDCVPKTLGLHFFGSVVVSVLAFFFVSKLPERCAPGWFDIAGHSHQFFHLSSVALTTSQMIMLPLDAQIRRELLSTVEGSQADFDVSILPFMVTLGCGLIWVFLVWILVARGCLHSNDKERKN